MAIDKLTQVNASVVFDKQVYERLKETAKQNKRSVSKQISYWVEKMLETDTRGDIEK